MNTQFNYLCISIVISVKAKNVNYILLSRKAKHGLMFVIQFMLLVVLQMQL